MENEFVSYEIALALKDVGFTENCLTWYHKKELVRPYWGEEWGYNYLGLNDNVWEECVLAPLYQQAFRWFRGKKYFSMVGEVDGSFDFRIELNSNEYYFESKVEYKTYDEAQNACLKQLIEIINDRT